MEGYIDKLKIAYRKEGEGQPLVILHGWGCNKEMFGFLLDHYKTKYEVYAFDLPGFGKSPEPDKVMNTLDYAQTMKAAFEILNIEKPIGIGHSFGGRILIKMNALYKFDRMVLIGSAGITNKKPLSYYWKIYSYKTIKWLYLKTFLKSLFPDLLDKYRKKAGSSDYNNASDMMKKILSTTVNEDLTPEFSSVKTSTLLLWGEKDDQTPLSDGKRMEAMFQDAGLVVFDGAGHFPFLERTGHFLRVLDAFI